MRGILVGIVTGIIAAIGFLIINDAVSLSIPVPDFTEVEVELDMPDEARIVRVDPITLDCRARIHAEVPVSGRREHSAFGQVYRTDRLAMLAIGDVDTCVEGHSVSVDRSPDGSVEVVVPAESIVFVRPRVEANATAASVTVQKGLLGKITDSAFWVSDDLGLTPLAYAYAQGVIGSSRCMEAAFDVTERLLIDAYAQQFIDQGFDPALLTVRIEGEVAFPDYQVALGYGVVMETGTSIQCVPSDSLGTSPPR